MKACMAQLNFYEARYRAGLIGNAQQMTKKQQYHALRITRFFKRKILLEMKGEVG
jgi:hypothetical protein